MSKVITDSEIRLSYVNLLEPRAQDAEKPDMLTYSTAILIPKTDVKTIEALKVAISETLAEGIAKKWGGKTPPNLKYPLRDGDTDRPDDETYKGMMFLNAKGPRGGAEAPILLDSNGNETDSASIIYSGVNARVGIQFYAFDKNGNRGVAAGIVSVLSSGKGEPLGSITTAESARDEFGIHTPADGARSDFAAPAATSAAPAAEGQAVDPWTS